MPSVTNAHWFGGVEKLPPNTVYIGRPSAHGNSYSSKSGLYTKEECVALHRVDLYRDLIQDPSLFGKLKEELDGKDLACWCKQHKRIAACHGDNYRHIFSPELSERVYDKSVLAYLVDDLRRALTKLKDSVTSTVPIEHYLTLYIGVEEAKLDITEILRLFKERETDPYLQCVWIANVVVDLELAVQDTDIQTILYRLDHAVWTCWRYTYRPEGRLGEPLAPHLELKRKPKVKADG